VVLEVDTVSVDVPGTALLIGTRDVLNEQLGAGVPPPVTLHERPTLPP
jgi:hypothetical protein